MQNIQSFTNLLDKFNLFLHLAISILTLSVKMAKNVAQSPLEKNGLVSIDQRLAMAKRCSHGKVAHHYNIFTFSFLSVLKDSIGCRYFHNAPKHQPSWDFIVQIKSDKCDANYLIKIWYLKVPICKGAFVRFNDRVTCMLWGVQTWIRSKTLFVFFNYPF